VKYILVVLLVSQLESLLMNGNNGLASGISQA